MNVLRVADIPNNRTGGMARFMNYISDEMQHTGHQVDFLFRPDLGLHVPERMRRFLVSIRVLQLVRRLIRQGKKYDAVEIHEPIGAAYGLARRFDRSLPPMVTVSYGLVHRCHLTMLAYYKKKGQSLSLKRRYGHYPMIWQADTAIRLADQVTVETTEDRDFLRTRLKIPENRITFVNGGVTRRFLTAPPLPQEASGVLFLATWIDRKGILDAIPALQAVLERHPDVRVTIAGFGGSSQVVAQSFPAPIQKCINCVPSISNEEALLELYQKHSVFLAPSIFEGQLLTMLESAAAGLAVVATKTCGMKDFIQDDVNGLLVEPGDSQGLTAAVLRLIEGPALARRLGAAAREKARHFTWKRSADQFLGAVEAALAHSRRRRT